MSGSKEIRTKIASVVNTQKITRAMEMVAASKMRKAQERMLSARPYAEKIRIVMSHLAMAHAEYQHRYMLDREVKAVGYIVVSTDRGLCGGLNVNLFRKLLQQFSQYQGDNLPYEVCSIGNKALGLFHRLGIKPVAHTSRLGDKPKLEELLGSVHAIIDLYNTGKIDRLYLARNHFENTMTQKPLIEQLLPITAKHAPERLDSYWDYLYEPSSVEIIDVLMNRYIESICFQAIVENNACEQAARMVAMKSATDNAGDLIDALQLQYNKARQAAITQELSEIVAGAAAV